MAIPELLENGDLIRTVCLVGNRFSVCYLESLRLADTGRL